LPLRSLRFFASLRELIDVGPFVLKKDLAFGPSQ